ncbi:MAG: hypothetical protein M0D57_19880 [Sphingobacteriales bacterium JAD_PAG50586_3]|nr:MAG: hypothetical protein M0D57_19880 [Sphingobacteriales bacterium JAD_PAG50586_3]
MLDIYKLSEQNTDHNHLLSGKTDVYLYTEMIDKGQHTGNPMHTMPSKAFDEVVTDLGITAEGVLTAPAVEVDNLKKGWPCLLLPIN